MLGKATPPPPPPDYRAAASAQSVANQAVADALALMPANTARLGTVRNAADQYRVLVGRCSYCGSKRKSAVGNCHNCGAPE